MNKFSSLLAGLLLTVTGSANAALFHFTGEIQHHNDVIYTYFTLDQDATNVRVWTDSYLGGVNFDPITAVWKADGTLIKENDDASDINPSTQTKFDSGLTFDSLTAGNYVFTVATFNNFANGTTLAQGFGFDSQAPIALENWSQPSSHGNMGHAWSLWLDGVDSATNPTSTVPEPSSLALFGLSLLGLAGVRKLRKA